MPLIKVVDSTPECYSAHSRDYQLISRLYDCIINGVKFDIDTVENLTNTQECSERILQLLQTKIGFFTIKNLTDDTLRYILQAFPIMVKNKGSKRSLYQAVYIFLKLNHITYRPLIVIKNKDEIAPYTITIYIKSTRIDTTPLDEMIRYLLPTGYTYKYVFYQGFENSDILGEEIYAKLIDITDTVNSRLREGTVIDVDGTSEDLAGNANTFADFIVGAVDTMEIIDVEDIESDVYEYNINKIEEEVT